MVINARDVGEAIFTNLKKEIKTLPNYFYNIAADENDAIVFRNNQQRVKYYYGDVMNFSFDIFYINFSTNLKNQLDNLEKINQSLIDMKTISIKNETYFIKAIYLNDLPNPNVEWVSAELDSYENTNQIYTINMQLNIMKGGTC